MNPSPGSRPFRTLLLALALLPAQAGALGFASFADGAAAYRAGDLDEAWRTWLPLAMDGNLEAQFALGMLCERAPRGGPCDEREALQWYERAALAGHRLAQFELATAFKQGRVLPHDEEAATRWFAKAAEQGLPGAQYSLALQYEQGLGVAPDPERARHWFALAARNGYLGSADDLLAGAPAHEPPPRPPAKPAPAIVHPDARAVQARAATPPHAASAPAPAPAPVPAAPASVGAAIPPVPAAAPVPAAPAEGTDWLDSQDPAGFTVQLAAGTNQRDLERIAERAGLAGEARVLAGGATRYLVLGAFATRAEAATRIAALPGELRARQPWARPLSFYRQQRQPH